MAIKTKVIRIFTAVMTLACLINIAAPLLVNADAESDAKAVQIIGACKGVYGPFAPDSTCGKFAACQKGGGDAVCKSIKALTSTVPAMVGSDAMSKCTKAGKKQGDCIDAWATCLSNHLKDGKVSDADKKTCSGFIEAGSLDDAKASKPGDDNTDKNAPSCTIQGIGWIVCPVMRFMAQVTDQAYGVVSSMLKTPALSTDTSSPMFTAWSTMRNFANVAFVIAFLIIIYSQVSGVGVSNYGIKKLLPRIIVAAILVNISYWICAIAVDISNILGSSLQGLLEGTSDQLFQEGKSFAGSGAGGGWDDLTVGVIAAVGAVAIVYAGLSVLAPLLLVALLAIVTVVVVLTARQALIILLVAISPLAFVAYLLPNTEQWFKRWRETFQMLLLMFPIISLIFGASKLASTIIMNSANGNVVLQVMAAGITIIPLAITPLIMKTTSGVLGKVGAFVNNPNRGPFDRLRKGAEGYRKNRQMLRDANALGGEKYRFGQSLVRRSARRKAVLASREGILKDMNTQYIAGQAMKRGGKDNEVGDNTFAKQMAGGGYITKPNENIKAAVVASALSQEKKMFNEDVASMEALVRLRFENNPEEALKQAIQSGNKTQAVAAQNILFKSGSGGVSRFRNTVESAEGDPAMQEGLGEVEEALKTNVKENHGQYAKQKGADVVSWANNTSAKLSTTDSGALSDNELAGQHSESLRKMVEHGKISPEQANRVLGDPRVAANLDDAKKLQLSRAAAGDTRAMPSEEELTIAHDEANRINQQRNNP